MRQAIFFFTILLPIVSIAQIPSAQYEKYPVFPECENVEVQALENCFNSTLQQFIFENFKVPEIVFAENYRGNINVLFEVTKEGKFNLRHVDAIYDTLKKEPHRVFGSLPQVKPATYNGAPAYV